MFIRFDIIGELSINNGDEIVLEFIYTLKYLEDFIDSSKSQCLITLRGLSNPYYRVNVCDDLTVQDLKIIIEHKAGIPYEKTRLLFKNYVLEADQTLKHYNIENYSDIHVALRLVGGKI